MSSGVTSTVLLANHQLPSLPVITDAAVRERVFTHRSYFARPTYVFEDSADDPSPDNERLEHLGDTVLGLVVTTMLMDTYPHLRVGPLTKIKSIVVENATLAKISSAYHLPKKLRVHHAQRISLQASKHVQADLLEAYIGGLYSSEGIEITQKWLVDLLKPYAAAAYSRLRLDYGLPTADPPKGPSNAIPESFFSSKAALNTAESSLSDEPSSRGDEPPLLAHNPSGSSGHLMLFNDLMQQQNKKAAWEYEEEISGDGAVKTQRWVVSCLVDGEKWGQGRAFTKIASRYEAAEAALRRMGVDTAA